MGSFQNYLTLLHKFSKALHPLNALKKVERAGKKRKSSKRRFSGFSWLNSPFAAMKVSDQLRQVFKFIDTNGDGKISTIELSEVLLCLGHENQTTAAKEAEGMVREVDSNGDGFIDLDEFLNIVAISDNAKVGSSSSSNSNEEEDCLMDAFLIFDTDKNGLISAEELQKVLINLGFENCSLHECGKMINGVDKDGDGFVNFDEFRSMMMGSAN